MISFGISKRFHKRCKITLLQHSNNFSGILIQPFKPLTLLVTNFRQSLRYLMGGRTCLHYDLIFESRAQVS